VIDPDDLIKDARSQDSQDPEDVSNFEDRCQKDYLSLQNQKLIQYLKLQAEWSTHIKVFLWVSTGLTWLMIFSLGRDWINYNQYPMFPHAVIGGFFAQIIGLGYVVVKYLFPPRTIYTPKCAK
jgi:hypothetical protein